MSKAIHVLSTAPGHVGNPFYVFEPDKFEVVCTVLSALMWREYNGTIKFYTDKTGAEFYDRLGLIDLWDAGVDTEVVQSIPDDINQKIFWSSSKLFALRAEESPVVMIDTDLIIWRNIDDILNRNTVTTLHEEGLNDCYLPQHLLKKAVGYEFDPEWDWTVNPLNTALACFRDEGFKQYYVGKAIDFMTGNCEYPKEFVSQMVFAEQRLLAMCARQKGIQVGTVIDNPFSQQNDVFTHLWGAKNLARQDAEQCASLISAMMHKIRELSSKYYSLLNDYL